jgi:hypothetical protein
MRHDQNTMVQVKCTADTVVNYPAHKILFAQIYNGELGTRFTKDVN